MVVVRVVGVGRSDKRDVVNDPANQPEDPICDAQAGNAQERTCEEYWAKKAKIIVVEHGNYAFFVGVWGVVVMSLSMADG